MSKRVLFVDGLKPCSKCKRILPPELFHNNPGAISGKQSSCKDCRNETCRKWCASNPERRKASYTAWVTNNPRTRKNSLLMYSFGITIEQYDEMFLSQGGACAICQQPKRLCVDHDHKTGKVRGLLCDQCNISIGKSSDDIVRLRRAIAYLEKHNGRR